MNLSVAQTPSVETLPRAPSDGQGQANAQVRFVQCRSDGSTGDFKIADLKKAENEARTRAHEDLFAGPLHMLSEIFARGIYRSSFGRTGELSLFRPTCTLWTRRTWPSSSMIVGRRIPRVVPETPCKTLSNSSSMRDTRRSDVKQEIEVCTDGINTRKVPHRRLLFTARPALRRFLPRLCPSLGQVRVFS